MTNLTDEGLMDEIERLSSEIHKCYCRAYERRFGKPYWTGGDYSKLDEPTKDYDREMAKFMLQQLQQVRDAAKKEERENCERIIRKRMVCEFDPRLSPMPDEKMGLCRELITAIRQME